MDGAIVVTIIFLVLAVLEGRIGLELAFRTRRTLAAAGIPDDDGSGLVAQEFGVYSLGIAAAYVLAALDPARFWGVALAGMAINLAAATMHLLRSGGIYFGDARPMMSRRSERKAGMVHAFVSLALCFTLPLLGLLS